MEVKCLISNTVCSIQFSAIWYECIIEAQNNKFYFENLKNVIIIFPEKNRIMLVIV